MREWEIVALLASGSIGWAVGGGLEGVPIVLKWVRRFAWPVVAGGLLIAMRAGLFRSLLCTAGLIAVNHLGYGDKTIWPVRVLVFLALPIPALAVNLHAWLAILGAGVLIAGLGMATRTWNWFTQKLFEFGCGFIQSGVIVISVLIR